MTSGAPDDTNSLAIRIRGLTKRFAHTGVLRDLDLDVEWGSFLVIFGKNGSGKTTLINILSTLLRPTEGDIMVGGFDLYRNPSGIRRNVGLVTHLPLLYEDLTAIENLRFHGRMFGLANLEQCVEYAAEATGVTSYLGRKAGVLSHGMLKRLSLARAILHDPPILLLDEPETGLDNDALETLGDMLKVGPRGRRTVLMTTHNIERGLELADVVSILSAGKIGYLESSQHLDMDRFRSISGRFVGLVE